MVWRTDNSSSVPSIPAIPAPGSQGFFSNGDPLTGQPATVVDAWWLNMIQEEIRNVVVGAGITPSKTDNTQLRQAIAAISGGNIYLPLAGGTMTGMIDFDLPIGPPTPQSNPNTGARLTLFDPGDPSVPAFAIGIDANQMWFGGAAATFAFYGGTSINARIGPNGSPVQPYDLVTLGYLQANARTMLTANRTYHIAPNGSDTTGDGSAGNPWQTLQYAWDFVNTNIDYGGYTVTISMAPGTYTQGLTAFGAQIGTVGSGSFIISSVAADNTQVQIHVTGGAGCINAEQGASIYVQHVTLTATASGGTGGDGMTAGYGGEVLFQDVNFSNCSENQIYSAAGGQVIAMGNYYVSGGAIDHAQAAQGGYILAG
jgi:hypothetical protein